MVDLPGKLKVLDVSVITTSYNNQPAVEIRRVTNDPELIKQIISCAFHDEAILILPTFRNKIKAISTLLDKGILYLDEETQEYRYTF
jgi:hypothetical protein